MASVRKRRPENAPGDFFVDTSCIDCDACRWIAPHTFARAGEQAIVHRQPLDAAAEERALMALVACPTASIGTVQRHDVAAAARRFPEPIDGGVHHCGYHDESSFGAASYLIVREAERGGNVLVDTPRFAKPLVRRLEELGGVRTLFLTHKDDVGDHQRFRDHFACERILHADDADADLRVIERLVEGTASVRLDAEIELLPVPGHTRGSMCLLLRDRYLFSGDHVAWSERLQHVYAFRDACWFDWSEQTQSMRSLLDRRFEWILPGHGRRCRMDAEAMHAELEWTVRWMERR